MRIRRRAAFVAASAAALGVGLFAFTGSAAAEPIVPACAYGAGHVGGPDTANKSCVRLKVTPANAPNVFQGSQSLGVRTRTLYVQPGNTNQGGKAKTVTLHFDNDFRINFAAGGGNCLQANIANKTVQQAYAACGPNGKNAYLSPPGTLSGRSSTAPPSNFGGCTMIFKGPTATKVLIYARTTTVVNSNPNCATIGAASPGNVTTVLVGTIANSPIRGFGKKLTVPRIDALAVPLDDYYATIKRGTYFQARCPAGVSPWRMRGIFAYSGPKPNAGGPNDTYNTTQPCS